MARPLIHFYASPKDQIDSRHALDIYKNLLKTTFPTLYAATNPSDDFAESFANYVHVVRMKKPWSVTITSGSEKLTFRGCWKEPACQEKRKLIEELLAE